MRGLRIAFVVQGEGRGHMTQALALARFLTDAGHEVLTTMVGRSPHRAVPRYFFEEMPGDVRTFEAPAQVPDARGRGVSIGSTALDAALRMPAFFRSGLRIHRETAGTDVVVNFLDLVGAASRVLFRSEVPCVAIAHNYLFAHPALADAPGRPHARRLVRLYTGATALRSVTRVALSFVPMDTPTASGLQVAPPLLRPGLDTLEVHDGGYLLSYALNPGYAEVIAGWAGGRSDVEVHCYVEGGRSAVTSPPPGFHLHELDPVGFLEHLAGCRAYVGSAGFESLCESFYLGKPTMAVPTDGQLEQTWNAWDAQRCGAAHWGSWADLDALWVNPPRPGPSLVDDFRRWVDGGAVTHVEIIERAASTRGRRSGSGAARRTG